jgi:Fe-S-cluster-containing dehydrogenase component
MERGRAEIARQTAHVPQWGMVVDLDLCSGCQACVVACFAENNIGMVGADQLKMQRSRHWIWNERYWVGEYPDVQARLQLLFCQQCGTAPCEPVCPVFASVHSSDGLNLQVYNRCVGTRYCGNNCPYKVRKFNFFGPKFDAPLEQQLNPDVTVRSPGLMEKCTFCVQRIRRAREEARVQGREVVDGEIQPACVQTCPTGAMTFGDQADPTSEVSRLMRNPRRHRLLESMRTEPSVVYLTRGGAASG